MVTPLLFAMIVVVVAGQRLYESRRSARNEAALRGNGAIEYAPRQVTWMRLLHGSWLVAMLAEVFLLQRPFLPLLAVIAATLFMIGQGLRWIAIRSLGSRWTIRIMTVPGEKPVDSGIYRHLRHPNYLGVVLEIAGLPLIHSAWLTAIVFSALNAILLWRRIDTEEEALRRDQDYEDHLDRLPRLFPRWKPR